MQETKIEQTIKHGRNSYGQLTGRVKPDQNPKYSLLWLYWQPPNAPKEQTQTLTEHRRVPTDKIKETIQEYKGIVAGLPTISNLTVMWSKMTPQQRSQWTSRISREYWANEDARQQRSKMMKQTWAKRTPKQRRALSMRIARIRRRNYLERIKNNPPPGPSKRSKAWTKAMRKRASKKSKEVWARIKAEREQTEKLRANPNSEET